MGQRTVELDEWANDKIVDILCAATAGFFAALLRVTSWRSNRAPCSLPPVRPETIQPSVLSPAIAANARIMLASSARRNSPRRSRRLPNGQRS
eukprot:6195123-Pleurochrysis_carterae.AAC.1